jgi:hypothetical protein
MVSQGRAFLYVVIITYPIRNKTSPLPYTAAGVLSTSPWGLIVVVGNVMVSIVIKSTYGLQSEGLVIKCLQFNMTDISSVIIWTLGLAEAGGKD